MESESSIGLSGRFYQNEFYLHAFMLWESDDVFLFLGLIVGWENLVRSSTRVVEMYLSLSVGLSHLS